MTRKVFTLILCALALFIGSLLFCPNDAQARGTGTGKEIVNKAEDYLGVPYGFDAGEMSCSDLTRMAVGRATGVWMPAWDDKQRFFGWQPRKRKPGDVLFYKENGGAGPITHVAIYIGDGWVIHSSIFLGRVGYSKSKYIRGYLYPKRIR